MSTVSTPEAYQDIIVEARPGQVGLITLNRPAALNALRAQLMAELVHALQRFENDKAIHAIVITGSERAFSAGADITEMADATAVDIADRGMIRRWHQIRQIRKPIIAAVSGHCLGGGCELALACDIIVAAENARFGQPEINIGVIPGAGGTQRLTKAVGKSIAMEVILNDRRLTAEEALRSGLVAHVYPVESYVDEALMLASQIAARAPLAVQAGKEAVNKSFELNLLEGMAFEEKLFYLLFASDDQKEGMAAFLAKRKPEWHGK